MVNPGISRIILRLLPAGLLLGPLVVSAQEPVPAVSGAPLTNLVFDAETKEFNAKPGDTQGTFTFQVTNVSDVSVYIINITASCSCTHALMPRNPWIIAPHDHEEFQATMNLANKLPGENAKFLTIMSTNGTKQLWVKSYIPVPEPVPGPAMTDRQKNQSMALADRQAVFRNDCAACHAQKSKGLLGAALYKEACGICHDSDHRATMVPELSSLNHPVDANFWRLMIVEGKEKTLMPAFSMARGGPLTPVQIDSLVAYLVTDFPREHKPTPQIQLPPAAPPAIRPPQASSPPPPPSQIQWVTLPSESSAGK